MKYRMIPFRYFSAAMNMAIDETLMEGIRAGGAPVIRFYGWEPSAVSIGYFQGLDYEVNREACRQAGVDVVRRITGGGAVYHDRDGEITYSILGPLEEFPADVIESYRLICGHIIEAFRMLGVESSFQPINDILVDGKKISGNAQARKRGVLLQHGTILYRVSVETMFTLLTVSEEKVSDKLIRSVKKRVTSLSEIKPVSFEALAAALEKAFSQGREVEMGDYTAEELARARQLAAEKYSTEAWVAMR
ncbi:MAG: lipoate--protein ligase family protein [Anaerolineae bacterium]|nr:lipoate--protein ligase family protein [Anaerolineae bacterium]